MIRVAVLDDHPLVIEGLERTIGLAPDLELVATATGLAEGTRLLESVAVDVVLVDIRLGQESGLSLIRDAQSRADKPAFLVLSSFDTPQYVDAALRLGASGFMLKTSRPQELTAAIRTIAAGGLAFEPGLIAHGAAQPIRLSRRERQIVDAVLRGRSNDEIGAELGISRKTVEGHLSKLFQRFAVGTRVDLAVRAERERWLDLPGAG